MLSNEVVSITSGALAGLLTDSILFPIDTIKTRLQSTRITLKSNLYRKLFSGLPAVVIVSAPNAAVFFLTYEYVKKLNNSSTYPVVISMAAAVGEISACAIRCPFEVLKQRSQDQAQRDIYKVFKNTVSKDGFILGLYRGYFSMVLREIPFSIIQFPIWEYFKNTMRKRQNNEPLQYWQSGLCGFGAGGIAAFCTTPLDVAKTRIMVAERGSPYYSVSVVSSLRQIAHESGVRGLFFGVIPRVIQISVGGAIFLGVYDIVRDNLCRL